MRVNNKLSVIACAAVVVSLSACANETGTITTAALRTTRAQSLPKIRTLPKMTDVEARKAWCVERYSRDQHEIAAVPDDVRAQDAHCRASIVGPGVAPVASVVAPSEPSVPGQSVPSAGR